MKSGAVEETKAATETATRNPVELTMLKLGVIRPSATNPRKKFDAVKLAELTESVKEQGIVQPLVVRYVAQRFTLHKPNLLSPKDWVLVNSQGKEEHRGTERNCRMLAGEGGLEPFYELIAGERRWRAANAAKLDFAPCIVRNLTDKEAFEIQQVENLHREDLTALEEAEGFQQMIDKAGYTADTLAKRLKVSRSHIYGRLKLVTLPASIKARVADGKLNSVLAELVAKVPGEKNQLEAMERIEKGGGWENGEQQPMSVRTARLFLENEYMLDLERAPFDLKDAKLVPAAGSCQDCPKRSENCVDLFPDLKRPNVCTDTRCYGSKKVAFIEAARSKAAVEGLEVMGTKESQGLFNGNELYAYNSNVATADRVVANDPKKRTLRQLLGKDAPKPVVVIGPDGTIHRVLRVAEAEKVLEEKGFDFAQKTKEEPEQRKSAEQLRKEKIERFVGEQTETAMALAVLEKVEKNEVQSRPAQKAFWLAFIEVMATWMDAGGADPDLPLQRRGLTGRDGLKKLEWNVLRAIAVEMLLAESSYHSSNEGGFDYEIVTKAVDVWDVPLKPLQARVRAEVEEANRMPKEGEEIPLANEALQAEVEAAVSIENITKGKINEPFEFRGYRWVTTGRVYGPAGRESFDVRRIVPEDEYKKPKFTYGTKPGTGYEGIQVSFRNEAYVLTGPKFVFVVEKADKAKKGGKR